MSSKLDTYLEWRAIEWNLADQLSDGPVAMQQAVDGLVDHLIDF